MKKKNKIFKLMDIVIIVVLLVLSFIPEIFFGSKFRKEYNSTYAEITVGGKLYRRVNLSAHRGTDELIVKTDHGNNIVSIVDNTITMTEADCPDQVCVLSPSISKPGQSIVCLPHKVMIQVFGENDEDIIFSY